MRYVYFLGAFLVSSVILGMIFISPTGSSSLPWTREKAAFLADSVLFYADSGTIGTLYNAGSAEAAVNILFPDMNGPNRSEYTQAITTFTSSWFNWASAQNTYQLYQMKYALDPYETKRKLFSLFEDIYAVNQSGNDVITFKDISEQQDLLFTLQFGNYQTLVKRLLYNNGGTGDYAEWAFLNLFNQQDPKSPNENYARELMQLFLMGEYEPFKSAENNDTRNYTENDVRALARILTGLMSDKTMHQVSFNSSTHYTGSLAFLTGALPVTYAPPFYNSASGTIDSAAIVTPFNGNNGITDNVIDYIFAKRSPQIALSLADRLYRFYVHDTPTRDELDTIAAIILKNNFEMLPSVKEMLALDLVYSDKALHSVRYKNPLELYIGSIKKFHDRSFSGVVNDVNLKDVGMIQRMNWVPYFPGSVFGRDGFDNSYKWNNTSVQNSWITNTNYFVYRPVSSGYPEFRDLLGNYRRQLTNEVVPVMTYANNSYTGVLNIQSGNYQLDTSKGVIQTVGNLPSSVLQSMSEEPQNSSSPTFENFSSPEWDTNSSSQENWLSVDSMESFSVVDMTPSVVLPEPSSGAVAVEILPTLVSTGSKWWSESWVYNAPSAVSGEFVYEVPESPEVEIASGSISSGSLSDVGKIEVNTPVVPVAVLLPSVLPQATTVIENTGIVVFPNFQIVTQSGTIRIFSGSYDAGSRTLLIFSGALMNGQTGALITGWTFVFATSSQISADIITADQIYDTFERYILWERRLPLDARSQLIQFLSTDQSGALIPIAPSNTNYYYRSIRWLLSILLSQPEYVILHGWDTPTNTTQAASWILDTVNTKIIFIELNGGNDYLTSIIPKDDYNIYKNWRTNASGTIAITGTGLVDIGDYYMNSALAYESGGTSGFKDLYDQGYLKLFNRVWAHSSQDHDAAARMTTSYLETTDPVAEGVFWHLINNEFNSLNTISLWSRLPNIYRWGKFVNMGGDIRIDNFVSSLYKTHIAFMSQFVKNRSFPGNTGDMFRNAMAISDAGKLSVANNGPPWATDDMYNVFKFIKILLQNNIGKSFYMGGRGGYDTHGNQFAWLNGNLGFVADSVTKFFNSVKDTQDITIVIFSEFGRTNRVNGDLGTDHGDGGGIYMVTSNPTLKALLPSGTYGNMSLKYARNYLGIGLDYRSIYAKIYQGLYGIRGTTYFKDPSISLENDISLEKNTLSRISLTNRILNGRRVGYLSFSVEGKNYDPRQAGYTTILTGTWIDSFKSNELEWAYLSWVYNHRVVLDSYTQPLFLIRTLSNQYTLTEYSGELSWSTSPIILPATAMSPSFVKSSILPAFSETSAPGWIRQFILWSGAENTVSLPSQSFELSFLSWTTFSTGLTSRTPGMVWYWWFILWEKINRDTFWPTNALLTSENQLIPVANIAQVNKIGPDVIGMGMKLNQKLTLSFTNLSWSGKYRVISSQDGITWSDVEGTGQMYQPDFQGKISFQTDHFSYFALLADAPVTTPPTCSMNISPSSVQNGTNAIVTWSLTNSLTGLLIPGNTPIGVSGNLTITPPSNATTQYSISTANVAGTGSCTASVTASVAPVPVPSCTLTSTPSSVTNGSGTLLTWRLMNASTGIIVPGNIAVNASGSQSVIPPQNSTTLYILTAYGTGGSNTCSTSVVASAASGSGSSWSGSTGSGSSGWGSGSWTGSGSGSTGSGSSSPPGGQNGGTVTGPGWGGGGSSAITLMTSQISTLRTLDVCLGGDQSGSPYDGLCRTSSVSDTINQNQRIPYTERSIPSFSEIHGLIASLDLGDDAVVPVVRQKKIVTIARNIWANILNSSDPLATRNEFIKSLQWEKIGQNSTSQEALDRVIYYTRIMKLPETTSLLNQAEEKKWIVDRPTASSVRYIKAENALTVRTTPILSDLNILRYLFRNARVELLEDHGDWSLIRDSDGEGYVKSAYLPASGSLLMLWEMVLYDSKMLHRRRSM